MTETNDKCVIAWSMRKGNIAASIARPPAPTKSKFPAIAATPVAVLHSDS